MITLVARETQQHELEFLLLINDRTLNKETQYCNQNSCILKVGKTWHDEIEFLFSISGGTLALKKPIEMNQKFLFSNSMEILARQSQQNELELLLFICVRTLASFILLDEPEFLYYYSLRTSYPLNVRASLNLHLFLTISCQLICVEIYLKMFLGEPRLSAVCSRKQNQFIIYTTQFISVYVKKTFFRQKGGALLKKN